MKRFPANTVVKLISILTLSLMMFLKAKPAVSLLQASFCLLFLPLAGEDGKLSALFAFLGSVVSLSLSVLGMFKWVIPFSVVTSLSYVIVRVVELGGRGEEFIRKEILWKLTQYHARMLYFSCLCVVSVFCEVSLFESALELPSGILSSLAFIAMFTLSFQSGMLPCNNVREKELREFGSPLKDGPDKDIMKRLYGRIVEIMEKEQPYLERSYGLPELTADVYTNRSYLSKTINTISGKSVPRFINSYRIKHAVMLINTEPGLKMSEVSSLSGFNNVASFNVWFKSEMKQTPSEYLDSIRFRSLGLPSNPGEGVPSIPE